MRTAIVLLAVLLSPTLAGEPIFPSSHYKSLSVEKAAGGEGRVVPSATTQPIRPAAVHQETRQGHSHRCPHDGTVWNHSDDNEGNVAAHRCPECGRIQWDKYQPVTTVTKQVQTIMTTVKQKPIVTVYQNCPNGVCPVQQPILFWRRR